MGSRERDGCIPDVAYGTVFRACCLRGRSRAFWRLRLFGPLRGAELVEHCCGVNKGVTDGDRVLFELKDNMAIAESKNQTVNVTIANGEPLHFQAHHLTCDANYYIYQPDPLTAAAKHA